MLKKDTLPAKTKAGDKQTRLASALKKNLRRRKAQERDRRKRLATGDKKKTSGQT